MATNRALSAAAQLDDYWLKLRMENDQLPIQHLAITDPARNLIVKPTVIDLGPKLSEALKIYIRLTRPMSQRVTTDSNHSFNIAPNLLNRNFSADQANQKWMVDISYIWTREGWLYLAIVLDLHSRRVIGWAVSNRMKRDLAIRALNMAIALRRPAKGRIHHSDRGS